MPKKRPKIRKPKFSTHFIIPERRSMEMSGIEFLGGGWFSHGPTKRLQTRSGRTLLYFQGHGSEGDFGMVPGYLVSKDDGLWDASSVRRAVKVQRLTEKEQKQHYKSLRRLLRGPISFW